METSQRPSLVAGIAGIASIVVATIPALKSIVDRWRLQKRNNVSLFLQDLYHDRDGRATEESTKAFSDSTRRASIAILSLSGLLVSLALAVLTTAGHQNGYYPGPTEQWFQFATWALLVVQAVSLFAEPSPQKRFSLGLYNATACAIFIVVSCAQVAIIGAWLQSPSLNSASDILVQAELIAAFLICSPSIATNMSQLSSLASHCDQILSCPTPAIPPLPLNSGFEIILVPGLELHELLSLIPSGLLMISLNWITPPGSQTLLESFENRRRKGQSLWKVLANEYFATFVLQFIFSSFVSVVSFAPQVALLGILRSLEARSSDSWNPVILWLWVFALGGSIIFYSTVESWLFWVAYYKLAIPVYEQLSAVVFAKSLRRKDVKGSQKSSEENLGVKVDTRNDEEDDDEDTRKTRQATINLIAVDAKRISDFASFNCIIIETIAFVSAKRVEKHLASADRTQTTIPADNITFKRATVAWPTEEVDENDERFALKEVDLAFPPKGLSVISGKTGSGKSLLLAAIIGEADIIDGEVHVPVAPPLEDRFDDHATKANWIIDSAIAYVSQVPWIENASIKDNILFGLPLDAERYEKVLFACALEKDFEMLPDGELTDIGANGINLSGGQKWRVSFARALYSRAGILVMDDLFSALDAHTGRHLHVHALTGELCHGRTRILVTHHVGLCLPQADYSVHLERGIVQHAGSVVELRRTGSLADILTHPQGENLEGRDESEETVEDEAEESNALQKIIPHRSQRTTVEGHGNESLKPQAPKKFQQEEKRETGAIKLIHYIQYFQNGGGLLYWSFVFFTFCAYAGLAVSRSWWVSIWTRSSGSSASGENLVMISHVMAKSTQSNSDHGLWFYLGIYFGLSAMSCLVGTLRYLFLLRAAIRSSRNLFKKLTYTVLRAPLRWLDTVPVGRILNRFTADFNLVDSKLPYELGFMLYNVLNVIGIAVAGFLVSPLLIVFAILLLAICMYFAQCFLSGAREIKRLESNAKSPIFEQFGSALIGLTTIRAFGKAQTYVERMYRKIDHHAQAYWNLWLFNRWLSFRMNVVGALFSTLTAGLVVSLRNIDAPLAGFALSFALQYTASIMWALRQYTNVELDMNATERVLEYSAIDIENQEGAEVPAAWPTEGRLEVTDLVVGYAPDLPPVLRGLSFTVAKNQRVGVVGRTGAGKSSLTLALFRFLEAWEGSIVIDGIDVSKIKLHDLRSRMAIIPQDPVLFSGSIKSNLDPFEEYSDAELRDALERVHLISDVLEESTGPHSSTHSALQASGTSGCTTPTLSSNNGSTAAHTIDTTNTTAATSTQAPNNNVNIFTNLSSTISEGGLNLSQGQRQLLCLARAIVSKPKIMVLDEATSAVDMATDALIQRSIRTEFGRNSTTLLVIAHRLSTIADFDKILVMDAGKAVEFGPPRELMEIQGGVFRSLVEESGEREALEKVILGEQE
ncbi:canalicular multispecific organic anion transporter 1 [Coccidioides immitis H538.4]|uniref:Canalicular multispecific organic anion transporter 1 n=1 Tax=Coccidioides immitis H538.4 TaxID=396776 RepID=A0A0J8UH58_COCIT|nr:canalicular multispecific organic anion transporter 1 [Coccidioides immitis H538.4]